MKFGRVIGISLFALAITGCRTTTPPPKVYTGPTEPMRDVVSAINQNNSEVPTLWSRGYFEGNVVDDKGRSHFVNGDIVLLYRRPDEMRLVGKKDIAGTIFEIGSNAEKYWLIMKADVDTMWWGSHATSAEVDPKTIPIPPELMLEVLGVGAIDTNFLQPPMPVMRFNDDSDVYMLVWNAPLADRWAVQKEVWYDRATKLPVKVLLFDADGRVVLRADLSKHEPVQIESAAADSSPKVATQYRLYFRESRTSVRLELDRPQLRNGNVPNDKSFAFPSEQNAGVSKVIQVDEHVPAPR